MFHGWQYLTEDDREAILRGLEDGNVHGGPYHIELDWVDTCNAACFFCNSEELQKGKRMPWPRAHELLTEARDHGLRSIRLSGGGEATLHPHLPDLLGFLAENKIVLDNLTTNGTLLNDRVLDAMRGTRINQVRVSLNYATHETYATGMGLKEKFFDRVLENTRKLDAMRRTHAEFGELLLQFMIYQPTKGMIRQMYELGRDLGADLITFRELDDIEPALELQPADTDAIAGQMREIIEDDWEHGIVESHLKSHGLKERIAAAYDDIRVARGTRHRMEPPQPNYSNRYCFIGWYSMVVMGNEAVYPCCFLLPASWLPPLASLETKSIQEVWHGPEYTKFRREMREFYLDQWKPPFWKGRFETIAPSCHSHSECPLTPSMCDDAFYAQADARLDRARATLGGQTVRLRNRLGRRIEKVLGNGR